MSVIRLFEILLVAAMPAVVLVVGVRLLLLAGRAVAWRRPGMMLVGPAMTVLGSGLALWRLAQVLDHRSEPKDRSDGRITPPVK